MSWCTSVIQSFACACGNRSWSVFFVSSFWDRRHAMTRGSLQSHTPAGLRLAPNSRGERQRLGCTAESLTCSCSEVSDRRDSRCRFKKSVGSRVPPCTCMLCIGRSASACQYIIKGWWRQSFICCGVYFAQVLDSTCMFF